MLPRRVLRARHLPSSCIRIPAFASRPAYVQTRHTTADAGDNKSGHITTSPNEGVIFFNNLLPINILWFYRVSWMFGHKTEILHNEAKTKAVGAISPAEVLQDAAKNSKLAIGEVDVVEVLPRIKEGGAFLKFNHDPATDPATVAQAVRDRLNADKIRVWWNGFSSVRAGLVLGKPWVEDLYRMPSRRLRVEFLPTEPGAEVAEQSQEQLYAFFRPYGKLADIATQSSDSKILPRYAYLDFARKNRAIMAKNCLHGYTVSDAQGGGKKGTVLRLTYEKYQRAGWVKDWLFSHPRIVIPLIAALIAGISIAVFDPIRTISIRAHITRSFHVEDNVVFRWFKTQSEDLINRVRQLGGKSGTAGGGLQVVWEDRKGDIEQIQSWLMETADTFIVVQGSRGSGKRELVLDEALKLKREEHRVLVVDCKPIEEARGQAATIAAAAAQVGYSPVFSWVNNISGVLDLAAKGLTGMDAGFSETVDNQLAKINNSTATALKSIALEGRKKSDKDRNLGDDEYLEAHPERRPVVVIDNFLHKSAEPGAAMIYDKLAEWAAQLTTSNIAHVIFLTNDVSYGKSLSKALPDRVFRSISLGDCSPEVAKRYVINHLDFDATESEENAAKKEGEVEQRLTPSQKRSDLHELDDVIPLLGGRLTDLEFLARRVKAGETPSKAVNEIIDQSSSEILKMFLMIGNEQRDWTMQQAWTLVRNLANTDALRFNEILLSDAFKSGGSKALGALEQAELISVQSSNGRPYSIKPGKPVYQSAFQRLVGDHVLSARMDLAVLSEAIGTENSSIDKYEHELELLVKLPTQPYELRSRVQWLLGKIAGSQHKVEGYEKQTAEMKKILVNEF